MMQSLHPVASPAHAPKIISITEILICVTYVSCEKTFVQFSVYTKGGFGQTPSTKPPMHSMGTPT